MTQDGNPGPAPKPGSFADSHVKPGEQSDVLSGCLVAIGVLLVPAAIAWHAVWSFGAALAAADSGGSYSPWESGAPFIIILAAACFAIAIARRRRRRR